MLRRLGKKQDQSSDAELLAAYRRSGDTTPLGELYARYMELVYGLCLKYLKDEGKAEDAVMGIFEELVRKTKEHEVDNFRSWLYVLAKNYCLMQLRKAKKNLTVSYEPEIMQSIDLQHPIDEAASDNGEMEKLDECLKQLKAEQKRCVSLFYLKGKSYKEIASMQEQSVGSIRSYIQNGRRNLRICMEEKKKAELDE